MDHPEKSTPSPVQDQGFHLQLDLQHNIMPLATQAAVPKLLGAVTALYECES